MNLIIAVVILLAATLFYTLLIRAEVIPPAEPGARPPSISTNAKPPSTKICATCSLNTAVGNFSDADYAQTKLGLQKELAVVIAEIKKMQPQASDRRQ